MGPEFFAALEHVRGIHANCRALLRSQHQRAGLELMDTMANLQEGAYEKLCRWAGAAERAGRQLLHAGWQKGARCADVGDSRAAQSAGAAAPSSC